MCLTGSGVDVGEACFQGLFHVFCDVLRQIDDGELSDNQGDCVSSELTVPLHLLPVPNARAGYCGPPGRDKETEREVY